ncbi:cell surface protein [Xylariaceae sp. FL0804]|nr:cell surface protein [Xylariaceae sp. FL0804]
MHSSLLLAGCGLLAMVSGHGLVHSIQGANGVTMPGLSVADGTPRDCSSPLCGSEDDTSIIRDSELGTDKASALGRTEGNGPVLAAAMVANFMGNGTAPTNGKRQLLQLPRRGLLGNFFGGDGSDNQGTKSETPVENTVAASKGKGATAGLPTCADDGTVTMTFRQINQDGAGPLTADVDGTSGGTDPDAFQSAQVTQDIPGTDLGSLSAATNTDFQVKVQMPAGMTCGGTVAGVSGVCVVRMRNSALAGPFGGSAAFVQSAAAQRRALAHRRKRAL